MQSRIWIGGVFAIALAGCTVTTVRPSAAPEVVPKSYNIVAIGDITASDELWHNYALEIRRALVVKLHETQAFSQVFDTPPEAGTSALLIKGQIIDVDKGSAAARWIVGFGAGRAHISAEFQITDPSGATLASYSVRKTYAGGVGLGGPGYLDMDDLAQKLGEAAADSLADWEKTGKFAAR